MDRRIHILGAAGSGTTTLGQELSKRLSIPHFDTDSYLWVKPSPVPFTEKRGAVQREFLLKSDLLRHPEWVLSGSFCDWGDFAIPFFTLVVFLWIPHDLRMERLNAREIERYGIESISPGGWFHKNHEDFMAYASAYDSASLDVDIRSKELHEEWMRNLHCKILRIEDPFPIDELTNIVEREVAR